MPFSFSASLLTPLSHRHHKVRGCQFVVPGTLLWLKHRAAYHVSLSSGLQLHRAENSLVCEWIAKAGLGITWRCPPVEKGPQVQAEGAKKESLPLECRELSPHWSS